MAAAIVVSIPVRHAFSAYLALNVMSLALTPMELDRLLARYTFTGPATTETMQYIGGGQWIAADGAYDGQFYTDWTYTGLTADHIYLASSHGDLRGFSVIRTAGTTTTSAAGANHATILTASGSNFTNATVVAPGDVVILSNGAHAYVVSVDSATQLTTDPLPFGVTYEVGITFYVARAPGSDTTATYAPTARVVDGKGAAVEQIQRWLTARSFQPGSISVGSASLSPEVEQVRQRLSELIGVGVSRA